MPQAFLPYLSWTMIEGAPSFRGVCEKVGFEDVCSSSRSYEQIKSVNRTRSAFGVWILWYMVLKDCPLGCLYLKSLFIGIPHRAGAGGEERWYRPADLGAKLGTNCAATTVNGKTEYWGNSYGYDAWHPALQDVTKMRSGKLEPDPQPEIDFLGGRSRTRTADLLLVRQAL